MSAKTRQLDKGIGHTFVLTSAANVLHIQLNIIRRHGNAASNHRMETKLDACSGRLSLLFFVFDHRHFYLPHSTNGDSVFWCTLFLTALGIVLLSCAGKARRSRLLHTCPYSPGRALYSAPLIVVILLAWYLLNRARTSFSFKFQSTADTKVLPIPSSNCFVFTVLV